MTSTAAPHADPAAEAYRESRIRHWDEIARITAEKPGAGRYYHQRLAEVHRFVISPGQRVLELGCGRGDLLASLDPSHGVGMDFSPEMLAQARQRHPNLTFIEADALDLPTDEPFDYIIISDLVNDLWDVQQVFERVRKLCSPGW